jgi:hypothetical protein
LSHPPLLLASATSVRFPYTGNGSALEEGSALVDVSALGVEDFSALGDISLLRVRSALGVV